MGGSSPHRESYGRFRPTKMGPDVNMMTQFAYPCGRYRPLVLDQELIILPSRLLAFLVNILIELFFLKQRGPSQTWHGKCFWKAVCRSGVHTKSPRRDFKGYHPSCCDALPCDALVSLPRAKPGQSGSQHVAKETGLPCRGVKRKNPIS
jgi:hypothetical protein